MDERHKTGVSTEVRCIADRGTSGVVGGTCWNVDGPQFAFWRFSALEYWHILIGEVEGCRREGCNTVEIAKLTDTK